MNIDKTDLKILKELNDIRPDKTVTTLGISRKLFDTTDRWEENKKATFVRNRLNKLVNYGLIKIEKNHSKAYYVPRKEKVMFGVANLRVNDGKQEYKFDLGDMAVLTIDGKNVVFEL